MKMLWELTNLHLPWIWFLVQAIVTLATPVHTASFYGASHLKVPLQDAHSTTYLFFKFRTYRPDGLLFLAAGSIDYCLLMLEGGEIKVRIDLGAGKAELSSPPGLKLNDMGFHEVELHRTGGELTLTVDRLHTTDLDIPGRFLDLNVKYGIFVGGLGGFAELFLGNIPDFRGCIDEIIFNDHDIIKMAADSTDQRNVFLVTWDCSEEFSATSHQPISFMERGSFVAFPSWASRTGGSVSFDIKTQTHTAILFYNAGHPSQMDFVTLELIAGKPTISLNEGNGVVGLSSDVIINDGIWHHVNVQFSPSFIELDVDGHIKSLRPGLGENRFFDLEGYFYVGGIELNKQSRALQNGLQSILSEGSESSLKGCIKNLKVNNRNLGLPESEITHSIQPDCLWEYHCLHDPCIPTAECYQDGVDGFRCMCDVDVCVRSNFSSGYKLYTKSSLPVDLEILSLKPLEVLEGESDVITAEHINVTVDFQKYGVRETGVLFHIIGRPQHGKLEVEMWRNIDDNTFTLTEINTKKLRYAHDGSESRLDTAVFELEFRANNYRLPTFLEEHKRFVFHVQISPTNDAPKLKLPLEKSLRLAKYTKKAITKDLLEAEDPDNSPMELTYTLLNSIESSNDESDGFVENAANPGKPVFIFTQEQINEGLISYVHHKGAKGTLTVRVSDGTNAGVTSVVKIEAFDLVLSIGNNTDIVLPYSSFAPISVTNLSSVHNSPSQELEIRYNIIHAPQYGNIQRLRTNNRWQTVNHFTQRLLKRGKVRYEHTTGRPTHDEFKFTLSCMSIKSPTVYNFNISFININLQKINLNDLLLDRKLESSITESELKFDTFPLATSAEQIKYKLVIPPSYGNLIQFLPATSEHRHKKLEAGDVFTQQDISSKRVKYKLHRKSFSVVSDVFSFSVECPGGIISEPIELNIKHVPGENDVIIIINEKVTVVEGGEATIGSSELHLEIPGVKNIAFNVTIPPKHGILKQLNTALSETEEDSVLHFTSDIVSSNRLVYVHDDSENDRDVFQFVAADVDGGVDGFVYYGTVHVLVIMKNDNPPSRIVNKVFHVVTDGERKITGNDLKYVDIDLDSKPTDIIYSHKGFPNGILCHVDSRSEVVEFTQEDLDNGNIMFKHSGSSYGKALLRITDGKFYAQGILEIQASKPYLKIIRNTGLIVKRGENGIITPNNLTVETNLNADAGDITYKITSHPKYGELLLNGKPMREFTQKDLDSENMEYENENSVSYRDHFGFLAFLGDSDIESRFEFRIYPEVFWQNLRIMSNRTLLVDEGSTTTINSSSLHIAQVSISPINITYTLTYPPRNGYLTIGRSPKHKASEPLTHIQFTQKMVDEGLLHYVQTKKNASRDWFGFDVSNGISTLKNLRLNLKIISKVIFLRTSNITVTEGREANLQNAAIGITNPYYRDRITDYLIIEQPRHGYIFNLKFPEAKLNQFPASHLRDGYIQYIHDGTETFRDWFTLVAKASELGKESSPSTIHVLIDPVNDEAPHIIVNNGLEVWEGDITTITNEQLAAVDEDSEAEDIFFAISAPSNGYVACKNDTKTPILTFTQENMNNGLIVFVHTGKEAGGFRMQVNDGLNYGPRHVFTVTSRKLKLDILTNEKLSILPRMQQSITRDHLYAITNDHGVNRPIWFSVTKGPTLGRLMIENSDGSLSPLKRFMQEQIDKNLVIYEHTKAMQGLSATDNIVFNVETKHAAPIQYVEFRIEISVGNFGIGNLDQMISLHPLEVREGNLMPLGQEHVDLSHLFSLWQGKGKSEFAKKLRIIVHIPPKNGWLEIEGLNLTIGDNMSFTREDIRKKRVRYHHDDSETIADNFTLGFYMSDTNGHPEILLFDGTIPVTVYPVNDHSFKVLTKASVLKVIEGEIGVLTPQVLNVSDKDGIPKDIVYDVMLSSLTGRLVVKGNEKRAIQNFTQEDINQLKILYIHESASVNSSSFNFKISDGKHKADYAVLHIIVVPITLQVVNNTVIDLLQGTTAVFLSSKHLATITNKYNEIVRYNITRSPSYGHIFVNDKKVLYFLQRDLNAGKVFYMQVDLTVAEDSFVVDAYIPQIVISNQIVKISVVPLVKQRILNAGASQTVPITLDVLNATKLAEQTASNPRYTVITMPEYGILKKEDTLSKVERESPTFVFTHSEIIDKEVFYIPKSLEITVPVTDSFEYLLEASLVQPAKGKFTIILDPSLDDNVTSSVTSIVTPVMKLPPLVPDIKSTSAPEMPGGGSFSPSIIHNDYLLITGIVSGVLLVTILIIISIKCRSNYRKHKSTKTTSSVCSHKKSAKIQGSHTTQSDLDISDNIPSNSSPSMSDDLPPPAPPTSPSSTSSRIGCMGSTTPKTRTIKYNKCIDSDPPLPPPPYVLENGEWTEVSIPVPTCKVTPIAHGEQEDFNETSLKAPYFLRNRCEGEDWSNYESAELRYGPPINPVLRKNQYWV